MSPSVILSSPLTVLLVLCVCVILIQQNYLSYQFLLLLLEIDHETNMGWLHPKIFIEGTIG